MQKSQKAREWGKGQRFFFKNEQNKPKKIKKNTTESQLLPSNPSKSHFGWRDWRLVGETKKEGRGREDEFKCQKNRSDFQFPICSLV